MRPAEPEAPFAALAARPEAGAADLLLAVSAEFRSVDRWHASGRLDEEARRLFGLASDDPLARAERLARFLDGELGLRAAQGFDPGELLLDEVLDRRRAHAVLIAALAGELATRAGAEANVYCDSRRWFVGLSCVDGPVLIDARLRAGCGHAPGSVRPCCPREIAFVVLAGLDRCFSRLGRTCEADRASRLRLALPIHGRLRAKIRRELGES